MSYLKLIGMIAILLAFHRVNDEVAFMSDIDEPRLLDDRCLLDPKKMEGVFVGDATQVKVGGEDHELLYIKRDNCQFVVDMICARNTVNGHRQLGNGSA
jgi:hypothetical protein